MHGKLMRHVRIDLEIKTNPNLLQEKKKAI